MLKLDINFETNVKINNSRIIFVGEILKKTINQFM
jgi:hypothetical protein